MTFAILPILVNELSLIERLQSWEIGLAKISVPSFRNLSDKLSMPAALDRFKPFKIFVRRWIFQNVFQNILSGDVSKIQNLSP